MAQFFKLTDPQVEINDIVRAIVPNTFEYTEGLGEQKSEVQSAGGGNVDKVDSENVETSLSSVKFSLQPTVENIELALQLKQNRSNTIAVTDDASGFSRRFVNATLNNDYAVPTQTDGTIDLEFMAEAAS